MTECTDDFPQTVSPIAVFANQLMHADKEQGQLSGLLIRTADYFGLENLTEVMIRHNVVPPNPIPPVKYLPSSYLHASLRAPGAIYQNMIDKEVNEGDFALLFGTKFGENKLLKEFQKGNKAITIEFVYPHDAATVDRGTVFDKSLCLDIGKDHGICVGEECLANGPGACGGCKVKPDKFGDLVSRWSEETTNTLSNFYFQSCYYDTIADAVTASNSLWDTRGRWNSDPDAVNDYQGYNECASSLNINDQGMADAIVLTLHRTPESLPKSLCAFPNHVWFKDRLELASKKGYGDLPVLFYRESNGIHRIQDCVTHFGGYRCDDAFQKEFFSQEYNFDGPCLHRPPGCDEVYYFPADGEKCSAFTDMGKERIERLCREEKEQDARVAYEKFMKPKERSFTRKERSDAQTEAAKREKARDSLLRMQSFQNTTANARVIVSSSTLLIQGGGGGATINDDWPLHVLFFLAGIVVSLLLRSKVEIYREKAQMKKRIAGDSPSKN